MRRCLLLAIALIIILSPAASATQKTHVVELGETLWSIAAGHGVSVDALAEANGLINAHLLKLHQKLVIPEKLLPPLEARRLPRPPVRRRAARLRVQRGPDRVQLRAVTVIYAVRSGDTLSSIALRHSTTIQALLAANSLTNPDALRLGQRLKIPTVAYVRAPVPLLPLSITIAQTASHHAARSGGRP